MRDELGTTLIKQAIREGIVTYNRHGVGSFHITNDLALQFTFDRYGVCDGIYGTDGTFQVRKARGQRTAYIIFND